MSRSMLPARSLARRFLLSGVVASLALAAIAPSTAGAQDGPQDTQYEPGQVIAPGEAVPFVAATAGLPDLEEIDPIRFDYDDAIVEFEQVTTRTGTPVGSGTGLSPTDTQIWVDIIRPDTDEPVPTILISSPYYNTLGRGWHGEIKSPHQGPQNPGFLVTGPLGAGDIEEDFPEWYDEYFVPRGYAIALMDLRGTRNSSGCQVYGDRDEVLDTVDVIDFIAEQDWSNGKIGMTGGSYDGTIANGAASEMPISARNPEALGAIIPIRSIGRWYDYHFFNGVQSQGHAATAALFTAALAGADTQNSGTDDLLFPLHVAERKACIPTLGAAVDAGYASPYQDTQDAFWTERDFVSNAADYNTAVFVISGLFDYNVKNVNTVNVWTSMTGDNPKKLWLANMDHADPDIPGPADAAAGGHIMPFPYRAKVLDMTHRWYLQFLKGVEAGALQAPTVEVQTWDGSWTDGEVWPELSTDLALYPQADGTLLAQGDAAIADGEVTWRDGPTSNAPANADFVTEPFEVDTRISGQIVFELDLAAGGVDTTVVSRVALLPPGVTDPGAAQAAPMWDIDVEPAAIASYGFARAWYRDSLSPRGVSSPTGGGPLTPGSSFELDFGSLGIDLVIPAGYSLGLRFSNSDGGVIAANLGETVTMALGAERSRILLPIAGAPSAEPEPAPVPAPTPTPAPLPVTGGGLALAALLATAVGMILRRR
ncbi:MAG: X-Pro dipeptidyl-peptidase [Glaciecola sp.]|jgi:X-Pro dipeptidyl-peptidase